MRPPNVLNPMVEFYESSERIGANPKPRVLKP